MRTGLLHGTGVLLVHRPINPSGSWNASVLTQLLCGTSRFRCIAYKLRWGRLWIDDCTQRHKHPRV